MTADEPLWEERFGPYWTRFVVFSMFLLPFVFLVWGWMVALVLVLVRLSHGLVRWKRLVAIVRPGEIEIREWFEKSRLYRADEWFLEERYNFARDFTRMVVFESTRTSPPLRRYPAVLFMTPTERIWRRKSNGPAEMRRLAAACRRAGFKFAERPGVLQKLIET